MAVATSVVKVSVEITGIPPGIMFQGKGIMELDATNGKPGKPRPPEEEAKLRAHWVTVKGKKQMALPWVMLYRSICKAGGSFKDKGKRTFQSVLAPTLACETDLIPLGTSDFETYTDWVRIPPIKGPMVKIGRPVLREWKCTIPILADCDTYNPQVLEKIIAEAGKNVGVGAWRPQLKGPWGRFAVSDFKIV